MYWLAKYLAPAWFRPDLGGPDANLMSLLSCPSEWDVVVWAAAAGTSLGVVSVAVVVVVDSLVAAEVGARAIHGSLLSTPLNRTDFWLVDVDGDVLDSSDGVIAALILVVVVVVVAVVLVVVSGADVDPDDVSWPLWRLLAPDSCLRLVWRHSKLFRPTVILYFCSCLLFFSHEAHKHDCLLLLMLFLLFLLMFVVYFTTLSSLSLGIDFTKVSIHLNPNSYGYLKIEVYILLVIISIDIFLNVQNHLISLLKVIFSSLKRILGLKSSVFHIIIYIFGISSLRSTIWYATW